MTKYDSEINRQSEEVDVIVIGAGGAGLSAAIETASRGAKTLVLEKQLDAFDSSTALSAGLFAFAGTDRQQAQGIEDSSEYLYNDILLVGERKNDANIVKAYADKQLDNYYWLERIGVKWSDIVSAAAGMSRPRGHSTDPKLLVSNLKKAAEAHNVRFLFNCPAIKLLADQGKIVCGVSVHNRKLQKKIDIQARRGVILATGGFAYNARMLASINTKFKNVVSTAGAGHTGDGHQMAQQLGAYLKDMEYVKPSFELHTQGNTAEHLSLMFYLGALIVNQEGRRFINESISYKDIGMASLDQPGAVGYQIFDKKIYETGVANAAKAADSMSPEYFVMGLDKKRISMLIQAETVEALALKIGVPQEALVETIRNYNRYIETGKDVEFGRTTLSGAVGKPIKIDKPPYYSFATRSHFLATYAGVAVDNKMRVLGSDGLIRGLYAAGEIIGGFHGTSYHTGTALGKAVIFGRLAGINVMEDNNVRGDRL